MLVVCDVVGAVGAIEAVGCDVPVSGSVGTVLVGLPVSLVGGGLPLVPPEAPPERPASESPSFGSLEHAAVTRLVRSSALAVLFMFLFAFSGDGLRRF